MSIVTLEREEVAVEAGQLQGLYSSANVIRVIE